ncbi:MAG TPA: bile acid:sodium symporter [Gammaproteobacteria bacterium]|nr:bile acid:sodium symporter [Gammaproteobacteria bacterium]
MQQIIVLAFQVSIVLTVFGFGLKATFDDLLYLFRRPGLVFRSLLAVFGVMPILAIALAYAFDFRRTVEIALIALSISPMPPLLPRQEAAAGERGAYALGLMALLGAAAIALVPLWVELLSGLLGRPLGMAPGAVAAVVVLYALLPLAAGVVVSSKLPALAARIRRPITLAARALLALAVFVLLAFTFSALWALIGDGTLIAMLLFLVAGVAVGHVLGGPNAEDRTVLALSTACRHPAIGLSIAATNYPDMRFGAAVLLYVLLGFAVGGAYVSWRKRREARILSA